MEYSLSLVKELFPECKCQLVANSDEYYVVLSKSEESKNKPSLNEFNVTFYVDYTDEDEEMLFIHSIDRKVGISGKEILRRIEEFCRRRNIKKISLEDDSYVMWRDHKIQLSFLNIMKKGLSYYNEQGYLQDTFTEDVAHWNNLKNRYVLDEYLTADHIHENAGLVNRYPSQINLRDTVLSLSEILQGETFKSVGEFLYDTVRYDRDEDEDIVIKLFVVCCSKIQYKFCQEVIKEL